VYLDIYLFYVYACSGGNNNKWSKNFDERPHRSELVTPATGESNLEPRFRRDALSPADKSAAPCYCSVCYLHSLMHFSGGVQPPKFPLPWGDPGPHLIHGSLAHPSPQAKRQLDRFIRFCRVHCCVQQTDRPRYIGSMRPHLCHRCTRCDLTALACVNNELLQSTDIHRTYPCCTLANMVDSIDRGHVWACPSMTPKTASFSGGGDRAAD